jgi:hypothetical protein
MGFLVRDYGKRGLRTVSIDEIWDIEIMLEHFGVGRLEEIARGSLYNMIVIDSQNWIFKVKVRLHRVPLFSK